MRLDHLNKTAEERSLPPNINDYQTRITFTGKKFRLVQMGRLASDGSFEVIKDKTRSILTRSATYYIFCGLHYPHYISQGESERFALISVEENLLYWCQKGQGESKEMPNDFATRKEGKNLLLVFQREAK